MIRHVLLLVFVLIFKPSFAQNCEEGKAYDKKYSVPSSCKGCQCKRAYWYHSTGEKVVYVWTGRDWVQMKKKDGYYWFKWDVYSRCGSHKPKDNSAE